MANGARREKCKCRGRSVGRLHFFLEREWEGEERRTRNECLGTLSLGSKEGNRID